MPTPLWSTCRLSRECPAHSSRPTHATWLCHVKYAIVSKNTLTLIGFLFTAQLSFSSCTQNALWFKRQLIYSWGWFLNHQETFFLSWLASTLVGCYLSEHNLRNNLTQNEKKMYTQNTTRRAISIYHYIQAQTWVLRNCYYLCWHWRALLQFRTQIVVSTHAQHCQVSHGPLALDALLVPKISKRHFFKDIKNSFHGVTWMALAPHENFFQILFQQIWSLEEFKDFAY